ncbi:hypothetical protein [Sanguibacter sp. 25GB23B1]|uniref:hypothetical protein n=1 Tax=unclassified Sanguibacter TaxID=2645534 RepID=UPI0032AF0D39
MSDLTTLMNRAAADLDSAPTPSTLDDDVHRGQHARRRRRGLVGTGLTGAFAATVAVGLSLGPTAGPAAAVDLVTYTEQQPAGFTIAEVPEGWHVLSSDQGNLILADGDDSGADANSFEGRIVASLVGAESLPTSLEAETFTVDGAETFVYDMLGADHQPSGTLGVFVAESDGSYLSVQLPSELHWDGEAAAQFAGGLEVTDSAEYSVG